MDLGDGVGNMLPISTSRSCTGSSFFCATFTFRCLDDHRNTEGGLELIIDRKLKLDIKHIEHTHTQNEDTT